MQVSPSCELYNSKKYLSFHNVCGVAGVDEEEDPECLELFWLVKLSVDYDLGEGDLLFTCKVGERFHGDRGGVKEDAGAAYCIPDDKSEMKNEYTWKTDVIICAVSLLSFTCCWIF